MGILVEYCIAMHRSVILTLALLAVVILADEAVKKTPEADKLEADEDDPRTQAKEELDKMDTNKDGKSDLGEITAYMKKSFYTEAEIKEEKLTPEQVATKPAADAKEYLEELDKNKDTFLDLDELTAHYKDDSMDPGYDELDEPEDDDEEE